MSQDLPEELNSQMLDQSQQHPHTVNQAQLQHATGQKKAKEEEIPLTKKSIQITSQTASKRAVETNQSEQIHSQKRPLQLRCQKYLAQQNTKDRLLCNMPSYFLNSKLRKQLSSHFYNTHSVIPKLDADRIKFQYIFRGMREHNKYEAAYLNLQKRESRGVGAVLAMAVCDALGASTQFLHYNKAGLGVVKEGFADIKKAIEERKIHARSGSETIWTDDASMGLCLGDSLLLNDYQFNPKHIRYMFTMWLEHGLNNGGRPYSIGLGGNISISMFEFMRNQQDYTQRGDRFNNGNGSLMRLAPMPVAFSRNLEEGVRYSGLQSLTTHNGQQAQECCKLMATIIIELINREPEQDGKKVLLRVCDSFVSELESVTCLARGIRQSKEHYQWCCINIHKFKVFNKSINDRRWNWRDQNYTYSPHRAKEQPGYVGSYCMDALSMALHTVLYTSSFRQLAVINADMGGDCDTVGSIAGQIGGALYGVTDEMMSLYSEMEDFTQNRFEAFLKGYKMATRGKIQSDSA